MAAPKIVISHATFNEIAGKLEQAGVQINSTTGQIILEKGTAIVPPIDMRMATIRRDCLVEACKVWGRNGFDEDIIKLSNKMFKFVLDGEAPQEDISIKIHNEDNKSKSSW